MTYYHISNSDATKVRGFYANMKMYSKYNRGFIPGFLRRNLSNSPVSCKKNAYLALVRSTLEYGAIVWDPYLITDINRLEGIQRKAARFITGDFRTRKPGCVTNMLTYFTRGVMNIG